MVCRRSSVQFRYIDLLRTFPRSPRIPVPAPRTAGPSTTRFLALSPRSFHSTSTTSDNHFDTHAFVERLAQQGLKREQAEGVMSALAEVVDESITGMSRTMVTKAEQEKVSP